jgi:hypothetical protein
MMNAMYMKTDCMLPTPNCDVLDGRLYLPIGALLGMWTDVDGCTQTGAKLLVEVLMGRHKLLSRKDTEFPTRQDKQQASISRPYHDTIRRVLI